MDFIREHLPWIILGAMLAIYLVVKAVAAIVEKVQDGAPYRKLRRAVRSGDKVKLEEALSGCSYSYSSKELSLLNAITDPESLFIIFMHSSIWDSVLAKINDKAELRSLLSAIKCVGERSFAIIEKLGEADEASQQFFRNHAAYVDMALKLTDEEEKQAALKKIAGNGKRASNDRFVAIENITDEALAQELYIELAEQGRSIEAIKKIHSQQALFELSEKMNRSEVSALVAELLTDQTLLEKFASSKDIAEQIRISAVEKLDNRALAQEVYREIASDKSTPNDVRIMAAKKLSDTALAQEVYYELTDPRNYWYEAIELLTDPELLKKLAADTNMNSRVRDTACEKAYGQHNLDGECVCLVCGNTHHDFQKDPNFDRGKYAREGWDICWHDGTCTHCRSVKVTYSRTITCPQCDGAGGYDEDCYSSQSGQGGGWTEWRQCYQCSGSGQVEERETVLLKQ